ncbi:hypothetical protein LIER_40106 [Lithospermum erythrorhizon]|uniref:Reverse transcriptase Ty1/copia-type domain-containing protein n=1 Tax=Lithospermum erythrorhizon TaxID=34254 RepID=A0AAV3QTT3_LITER
MEEEMSSLHKNNTYILVNRIEATKILKNKWIFKLKYAEGSSKHRLVLGLAASLNLEIEQLDVKIVFLHGNLDEEIFMEQPEGFKEKGKEDMNFRRTQVDHYVYVKEFCNGEFIILLLYVDDMLLVRKDIKKIVDLKENLSKDFEMKDLGHVSHILGMEIRRNRSKGMLWLSQEEYVKKVLKRFNMESAKSVNYPLGAQLKLRSKQCPVRKEDIEHMNKVPYASAVGIIMYAMTCTRPDLRYAIVVVSRFLSNPGKEHWEGIK